MYRKTTPKPKLYIPRVVRSKNKVQRTQVRKNPKMASFNVLQPGSSSSSSSSGSGSSLTGSVQAFLNSVVQSYGQVRNSLLSTGRSGSHPQGGAVMVANTAPAAGAGGSKTVGVNFALEFCIF